MSKKRAARSKQSDQSKPSPIQWSIVDLFNRAKKHCDPIHHDAIEAQPSDFLVHLMSATVLGFEDILAGRETLTAEEQADRAQQQARERDEQNLNSLLSRIQPQLEAQKCVITPDYREELIQEQLRGSSIEIQSFLEAANLGVARFFLASRNLTGYAEAKESVRQHNEKDRIKFSQWLASILAEAENGESFDDQKIKALNEEFKKRQANRRRQLRPAEQYRKAFFAESQPAMIMNYWLPFCLWCFDTSDCVRILCQHSPGARIINDLSTFQQFTTHVSENIGESPALIAPEDLNALSANSAISNSNGKEAQLNKETFRVHVSRLKLYRHKPAHWSLPAPS